MQPAAQLTPLIPLAMIINLTVSYMCAMGLGGIGKVTGRLQIPFGPGDRDVRLCDNVSKGLYQVKQAVVPYRDGTEIVDWLATKGIIGLKPTCPRWLTDHQLVNRHSKPLIFNFARSRMGTRGRENDCHHC